MLTSVVLELDPPGATFTGSDVHGWFLQQFLATRDAKLATWLHTESRHKPFALGAGPLSAAGLPRRSGAGPRVVRISSTTPALSALLGSVTAADVGRVRLGDAHFAVRRLHRSSADHPLAGTATLQQLVHSASAPGLPGRVRLRFISPTAFKHDLANADGTRERRNRLFPAAPLVFDSLARAWNGAVEWAGPAAAALVIADPLRHDLLRLAREEEYALETLPPVAFNRFSEKGFAGECEYSLGRQPTRDLIRALHLLALFGFFSGVGMRTQMGMGQVICVRG